LLVVKRANHLLGCAVVGVRTEVAVSGKPAELAVKPVVDDDLRLKLGV